MNILELCTSRGRGGLELYALQVIDYLAGSGHHVHAAVRRDTLLDERLADRELPILHLHIGFPVLPIMAARKLAHYIEQHSIDIVHVHWNRDLILVALAKRFSRREFKLLFIRHMAITRYKDDAYHRFIYEQIDKYLVITRNLHAEAIRYLPLDPERIEVLYHGVEVNSVTADRQACDAFLAQQGLGKRPFRILLPGRIEHYKGQHLLVEAMVRLEQQGHRLEALIMGHVMDEDYQQDLQKQIRDNGLDAQIRFCGFVEQPQQYYPCFDVVILTTYAETFGLVLVEAMQSGVAVVGTRAGGVPEIVEHGETGLMFEPGNSEELADCLRQLNDDPARRQRLAQNGRDYAQTTFSKQKHFSRLEQIFNELASGVQQDKS